MLLMMKVRRWPSVVGALGYGLSTYFFLIISAGHITKMWALVYAPLMVGAVWYSFKRNRWAGAAMTALFTALQVGANVVMPNLSPQENRKLYSLYDNKRCMGDEAAEGLALLRAEMKEIGYTIVSARGDALLETEREVKA